MAINDKPTQRISAEDLVTEFLEGGKWYGRYGYASCPLHNDQAPSLQVTESDERSEGWFVECKASCDGLEVKREINRLLDAAGIGGEGFVPPTEEERELKRQKAEQQAEGARQFALRMWDECGRLGSNSQNYRLLRCLPDFDGMHDVLRDRSTKGDGVAASVRYPVGTAHLLVALYRDIVTDEPVGVQRFFLNGKQEKLGKWMLGPVSTGAIKFGPIGDRLTVAEGCESGWTAHACGLGPAWALGSAGAVATFEIPEAAKELLICYEHDEPDEKGRQAGAQSVAELAKRALALGKRVLVLDPLQGDINDLIMGRAGHKGDAVKELAERGLVVSVLPEMEVPEQLRAKGARMIEVKAEQTYEQMHEHEVGDTVLVSMADLEAKPIDWLWHGRIACGKVSGLQGNPGVGKSQISCLLAAIVSKGGDWPDGTPAPQGSVILITCEDDPADTIKPRLQALDADLNKIHIHRWTVEKDNKGKKQKVTFNLPQHAKQIRSMMRHLGDVKLIIIDPVSAFMGKADGNKGFDVRAGFAEMQTVIGEFSAALVIINHLNKAEGLSAMSRASGSMAFNALCRAVYLVCVDNDTEDKTRRLMLPVKNNLGDDKEGFAYRIQAAVVHNRAGEQIETSKVVFETETVSKSADDALKPVSKERAPPPAVRKATEWLFVKLADMKPHLSAALEAEADELGISDTTLKRARGQLRDRGEIEVKQADGQWTIRLVPHDDRPM